MQAGVALDCLLLDSLIAFYQNLIDELISNGFKQKMPSKLFRASRRFPPEVHGVHLMLHCSSSHDAASGGQVSKALSGWARNLHIRDARGKRADHRNQELKGSNR